MDQEISNVLEGARLTADRAEALFDWLMTGEASDARMAALLTALRDRGETPAEVAGGVRGLRNHMVRLRLGDDGAVDTCGTGGGSLTTFNISTAAAFVAVAAGARVAKHGNRSFTSRCGSADVLERLGLRVELSPDSAGRLFRETGFTFMYAPAFHPAMRHVGPVRRQLGVTTIMNLLGPLANPAEVSRQVVGVARPELLDLVAGALVELGHRRAMVVHGQPGVDELSPIGPTRVVWIEEGRRRASTVEPRDFGWFDLDPAGLAGGEVGENAERVERILRGQGPPAGRAAVALNAAAALWVAGVVDKLESGVERALACMADGAAWTSLERVRAASDRLTRAERGNLRPDGMG